MKVENYDYKTFMEKYPHNTDAGVRKADLLVGLCYQRDRSGCSLEEFVQKCLDNYGGTVVGAMIDYLNNHL